MGKKAKEHRKKVAARNERIKNDWKRISKAAWETFDKMKEEKNNENQNNQSFPGLTGFGQKD
jgi:hypothetical protein